MAWCTLSFYAALCAGAIVRSSSTDQSVDAGERLPTPLGQFVHVFYAALLGILVGARAGERDSSLAVVDGLRAMLPSR